MQQSCIYYLWFPPRQKKNPLSHFSLHMVRTMDFYYALADSLDTLFCFLVFHETEESPKGTNHPMRIRPFKEQPIQFESHHRCKCRSHTLLKICLVLYCLLDIEPSTMMHPNVPPLMLHGMRKNTNTMG